MDFEKVKKIILKRMQDELPGQLYYHRMGHTLDVLEAAERIAEAEGVIPEEITLIKTAAVLHDSGFIIRYDNNESAACEIACRLLPECEYTQGEVMAICAMIMATALPQSPQDRLSEILCDADLDYLGRDDFYSISEDLRKELMTQGRSFGDSEWLKFEIDFLEKHEYFTETSRRVREPGKQKYLSELKNALAEK